MPLVKEHYHEVSADSIGDGDQPVVVSTNLAPLSWNGTQLWSPTEFEPDDGPRMEFSGSNALLIHGGPGADAEDGGPAQLLGGDGNNYSSQPAKIITHGGGGAGAGGQIEITSGAAQAGTDSNGGNITITPGSGDGSGVGGAVTVIVKDGGLFFEGLPTDDPEVVGAVWSNEGILTVSAG